MTDLRLPSDYPDTCPTVNFLTTGGGQVRFNPNLYNCGKVCLSLLGTHAYLHYCRTWSMWSTLYQHWHSIPAPTIIMHRKLLNEPA